jgi:RNase adapter protein RapZ
MIQELDAVFGRTSRERRAIFIDYDDEQLERRYTENCRPRPIAGLRPIMGGTRLERRVISTLRDRTHLVVHSSNLTVFELKRLFFVLGTADLRVFIISFAYCQGIPRHADLIFDVRFLENPHYVPGLRPLSGRQPSVAARVECDPRYPTLLVVARQLLQPFHPRDEKAGKTYVLIGIGCAGGEHWLVFGAGRLAAQLQGAEFRAELSHLDILFPGPSMSVPAGVPAAGV